MCGPIEIKCVAINKSKPITLNLVRSAETLQLHSWYVNTSAYSKGLIIN